MNITECTDQNFFQLILQQIAIIAGTLLILINSGTTKTEPRGFAGSVFQLILEYHIIDCVKLLTSYEPDLLATIVFNVGGGRKMFYPVHCSVLSVHMTYYGKIRPYQDCIILSAVTRVDRVMYIDLKHDDEDKSFTNVIFSVYVKHFHYDRSDLLLETETIRSKKNYKITLIIVSCN